MIPEYPHPAVPPTRPGQATTACILSFVGSGLAVLGLALMVIALTNDDIAEDIADGAGVGAADADVFATVMTWLSAIGIVLAVVALVVTPLLLQGRSVGRILFTVVASFAILSSLTFFPVGLLWGGVCVASIVLVWQRPVSAWIEGVDAARRP